MKKVLITATVMSHICQFHKVLADMLHKNGYEVHVAAKDNLHTKEGLTLDFADKVFNVPFSRSPKSSDNIKAYKMLKEIIKENDYDIIHCNTPVGGVVTRLAAKKTRAKIIYTAHGFHFYKGAPIPNWVIYYPIEKIMSKYTDMLITINEDDYQISKDRFNAKSYAKIPGVGIDFKRVEDGSNRETVRKEMGFSEDDFVLLSVGELNKNKNNITILKAIKKLNNPKIKYMMAGNGPLKDWLEEEIEKMGLSNQVRFLGYTREIGKLHKASDAFCFASIREGLGLAAIEAMHSGLPIITSDVRGINDYSIEGVTGFKSQPLDENGFALAIEKLMKDSALREKMGKNNIEASIMYGEENVAQTLEKIYLEVDDKNADIHHYSRI
ncbi:MAG: glycosyltransferase family 4 protein [Clostridia bacterium]|nr:glycosyltransferase family 4 protein [Clostridia bacterium]